MWYLKAINTKNEKMKTLIFACTFITLLAACNSNPKVIEAVDTTTGVEQPAADPAAKFIAGHITFITIITT